MSVKDIDSLRASIERCWNVPVGILNAEDAIVELRLLLKPDGSIEELEVLDSARMVRDHFYRTAADSAVQAVERCSPLAGLPPEKYDAWRVLYLTFDPSEYLGQ